MRDNEPIVLSVDREGRVYLNIGEDVDSPIDEQTVVERTAAALRRHAGTPVLVKGDQGGEYGRIVTGMVLQQRGGAEKVGFITDPLSPESP